MRVEAEKANVEVTADFIIRSLQYLVQQLGDKEIGGKARDTRIERRAAHFRSH